MTSIGWSAFSDCKIKGVSLPQNLTDIDGYAFYNSELTSIEIPEKVATIGMGAFEECASLTKVKCDGGQPAAIGTGAFPLNICGLYVPEGKVEAYKNSDWGKLFLTITDDETQDAKAATNGEGWRCEDGKLTISADYEWEHPMSSYHPWRYLEFYEVEIKSGVTEIGDDAFVESGIRKIDIPESVTKIGERAFDGCNSLATITIPKNVTSIEDIAFWSWGLKRVISMSTTAPKLGELDVFADNDQCPLYVPDGSEEAYKESAWGKYFSDIRPLSEITWTLTDSVLTIKKGYEWTNKGNKEEWKGYSSEVKRVVIEDGVTQIGKGAFGGYENLDSVVIAQSVENIGEASFSRCGKITWMTIPQGVTSIGSAAFSDCGSLAGIDLPQSLTTIGDYAFYECASLKSVNIPDGVHSIPEATFSGCNNLSQVKLPEELTSMGSFAFENCESLTEIDIPEGVYLMEEYAFAGCKKLTSISLPQALGYVAPYMFDQCKNLTSVMIPEGVEDIYDGAFYDCQKLEKIVLPQSLTEISDYAFYGCELSMVTCLAKTPPEITDKEVFIRNQCPLYVPEEAVEAYRASAWSKYFDDIRPLSELAASAADVEAARPAVRVRDGMIEADGGFAVYDMAGRRMPGGRPLPAGAYVVETPRGAERVAVR